jgi:hypothetical protein
MKLRNPPYAATWEREEEEEEEKDVDFSNYN